MRNWGRSLLRAGGALLAMGLVLGLGRGWVAARYQAAFTAGETVSLQAATALGANIERELRRRMLANDLSDMPALVAGADGQSVQRVVVIGPNNHVYLDSETSNQGVTLTQAGPHCAECHHTTPTPSAAWLSYVPNLMRVATPIKNATTCSSCHASSNANLGVVLVDVSLSSTAAAAQRSQQTGWVWVGLGTLLAGALVWGGLGLIPGLHHTGRPVAPHKFVSRAWLAIRWGWLAAGLGGLVMLGAGSLTLAHVENHAAFCAACHTQPETDFYARSQAPAVDLASAHSTEAVACIDCHSGVGVLGRLSAETEGAGNVLRFVTGQYNSPGVIQQTPNDANCLKCHADLTADSAPVNHFHFYLAGWQQAQPAAAANCVTCHPAHTPAAPAEHFVLTATTAPVCEACHTALD